MIDFHFNVFGFKILLKCIPFGGENGVGEINVPTTLLFLGTLRLTNPLRGVSLVPNDKEVICFVVMRKDTLPTNV